MIDILLFYFKSLFVLEIIKGLNKVRNSIKENIDFDHKRFCYWFYLTNMKLLCFIFLIILILFNKRTVTNNLLAIKDIIGNGREEGNTFCWPEKEKSGKKKNCLKIIIKVTKNYLPFVNELTVNFI